MRELQAAQARLDAVVDSVHDMAMALEGAFIVHPAGASAPGSATPPPDRGEFAVARPAQTAVPNTPSYAEAVPEEPSRGRGRRKTRKPHRTRRR